MFLSGKSNGADNEVDFVPGTIGTYDEGYADGLVAPISISKNKGEVFAHKDAVTKTYTLAKGIYVLATTDGRATDTVAPSQTVSGVDSTINLANASSHSQVDASYCSWNNLKVSIITMDSGKNITINFNSSNHSSVGGVFIGEIS